LVSGQALVSGRLVVWCAPGQVADVGVREGELDCGLAGLRARCSDVGTDTGLSDVRRGGGAGGGR